MERPDVERIQREAKSLHHRNFPGGINEAYRLEDRLFDEDIPALLAYITALEQERDRLRDWLWKIRNTPMSHADFANIDAALGGNRERSNSSQQVPALRPQNGDNDHHCR